MIWDRILRTPEDSLLKLRDEKSEYPLADFNHKLKDVNVQFSLYYDVMPLSGALRGRTGPQKLDEFVLSLVHWEQPQPSEDELERLPSALYTLPCSYTKK